MGLENGKSERYSWMIGKRFDFLTVESVERTNGRIVCHCVCKCGTRKNVRRDHLISGKTASCGCLRKITTYNRSTTHGMKNTRLYRCWRNMKTRCYNPGYIEFDRYGGRGISVCDEWQSFLPFCLWALTHGYSEELSLDRIDNNGDYCPDNCRWATPKEQSLKRCTNVYITYNGTTKHISEWDKEIGASKSGRVRARLNAGWSVEKAVTTPVEKGRNK